jgi:VIT1/CCC1 family predicted Fe2+/Mn2+ transporter
LRAAVLGANDGVLSITSLLIGVTSANMTHHNILIAGVAGLVGGALSMGAGEYVSVSSQADIERADLDIERHALKHESDAEHAELRDIYIGRGVESGLATQVAEQMMKHDALGAHARDEIGITDALTAKPLQAAGASLASFVVGAIVPLISVAIAPEAQSFPVVAIVSLAFLALLGALAAHTGGASVVRGAVRVLIWGVIAMGVASVSGALIGVTD